MLDKEFAHLQQGTIETGTCTLIRGFQKSEQPKPSCAPQVYKQQVSNHKHLFFTAFNSILAIQYRTVDSKQVLDFLVMSDSGNRYLHFVMSDSDNS